MRASVYHTVGTRRWRTCDDYLLSVRPAARDIRLGWEAQLSSFFRRLVHVLALRLGQNAYMNMDVASFVGGLKRLYCRTFGSEIFWPRGKARVGIVVHGYMDEERS